jgi:hypothetical protein
MAKLASRQGDQAAAAAHITAAVGHYSEFPTWLSYFRAVAASSQAL